jgi:phosphate transport system protein
VSTANEHIVKSFDDELQQLRDVILRMGGLAEAQLASAVEALVKRDNDLARQVVENDAAIDELEQTVDDSAMRLLALRQPMADDLREVISALRIASDLERIGDYAKNVAKRATVLSQVPAIRPTHAVPRMARQVQAIIKDMLDAFVDGDAEKAVAVWRRDEEVDEMYTSLFRELLTYMMEDPRNITPATHLLFIAKNIERMGDHATNVAELIHFRVTGRQIEGGRPKGDTTSFQVVTPADGTETRDGDQDKAE